jgi:hypothetical protein
MVIWRKDISLFLTNSSPRSQALQGSSTTPSSKTTKGKVKLLSE